MVERCGINVQTLEQAFLKYIVSNYDVYVNVYGLSLLHKCNAVQLFLFRGFFNRRIVIVKTQPYEISRFEIFVMNSPRISLNR